MGRKEGIDVMGERDRWGQVGRDKDLFFSLEFVCGQESCAQTDRITQGILQSWRTYVQNLGDLCLTRR